MLNFFTCPKKLDGKIEHIQQQAMDTWKSLSCEKQILIIDEDTLGKTIGGAPRVDDLFRLARINRNRGFLAYSNADITFDNSLVKAIGHVLQSKIDKEWLIVGETKDENGKSRGKGAIDWAVFTPNAISKDMPPFALGRIAWDNWLILQAIDRGIPVVDASDIVNAVHLKHDYSHIQGGREETRQGVDAQHNFEMAGRERAHTGKITAAPYKLDSKGNLLGSGSLTDIVTPTIRGREKFLERCKQSVKNQRYHEHLISHIIKVDEKGGGRSKARNDAIRSGKGKYICLCDDDDFYYPNHISTVVNYMEFSGAAACYSLAHKIPEDENMRVTGEIELEWRQMPYDDVSRGNFTPTTPVCIRRDALEKVGLFDESLDVLEDWDLMCRLQKEYGMWMIDRVTCAYSSRETGTIANPEYNERKWAAAAKIQQKYS